MSPRVGIPRALSFYRDFPLWRAFLEGLGAEVVLSPPTTRATLEAGAAYTVPEACLPLKLFCGHVQTLIGQCDFLLVPSILRIGRAATNCAKLIGLPDMLQATMEHLPPLIAPSVDLSEGIRSLLSITLQVSRWFTLNPLVVREAALNAWETYTRTRESLRVGQITPADFWTSCPHESGSINSTVQDPITIVVVGHPYVLYDSFVNHNLLRRLAQMGTNVLTPEKLAVKPGTDYWAFEYEFVGAAQAAVQQAASVDGLLAAFAFGCGPDGVMLEQVRQIATEAHLPLLALAFDEHSGEAGFVTRLEAFLDLIVRRKRRTDGHLSRN